MPRCSWAYDLRGHTRRFLGNSSGALNDFLVAIELDPISSSGIYDLARLYRDSGRHSEALEVLKTGIHRMSTADTVLNLQLLYIALGRTYCELHNCTEARRAFEKAIEYSTTNSIPIVTSEMSACLSTCRP